MRYLLVGNYGVGNLGDEALKDYFMQKFDGIDWKVVSAHPQANELPRLPGGIRSFLKFDWLRTMNALWKSDGIVFGGGSLFTDVESSYACFLWWSHAFWAWLFRKKIMLTFQGVGPCTTFFGVVFSRWVVRRATSISVRDDASFTLAKSWRKNGKIVQSFDPIFSLIEAEKYDLSAQKNLVVIPRKNSGTSFKKALDDALKTDRWDHLLFLSLQPDDESEKKVVVELRTHVHVSTEILPIRSLSELVDAVSKGSFILSQRYHGAVAAIALGRELQVVEQGNDDKLASIQRIIDDIPLQTRKEHLLLLVQDGEEELRKFLSK